MNPLKRLEFKKLKGATNNSPVTLDFDEKKPIVMIYGENGTGKSSIIDALDFICNEQIGSFENVSFGSGKKIRYCPSINADNNDVEIKLSASNQQQWTGVLGPNSTPSVTGPSERPVAKILRRNSLLSFIAAEPKQRYEQLSAFITSPQIDQAEKSLGDLIKEVSRTYDFASEAYGTAKENLEKLWQGEGAEGKSANEWAEGIVKQDTALLETEILGLQEFVKQLDSIERNKQELERLKKDYQETDSAYQAAETEYKNQLENAADHIEDLSAVLSSAELYFNKVQNIDSCPVCLSKIDQTKVANDIKERNQDLVSFKKAKADKERKAQQLQHAKEALETKITESITKINKFKIAYNQSSSIGELNAIKPQFIELEQIDTEKLGSFVLYLANILECKGSIETILESKRKITNRKNAVTTYLENINGKKEEAERASEIKTIAENIRSILEEERKGFIDSLLDDISSEVDSIYQRMHPQEKIGNVLWKIDQRKRNSIDVSGSFVGNNNIPPQAYYSEAHLDTLGIAIFLGLARKFGSDNTIIILDDILTSVDESHISRFLDILHDLQDDFLKIIITTHYRPWRDRYKYARGPAGNIQFIELLPWTLEKGIRHTKTKLNLEELEDVFQNEPFDRQAAASKAGIFLENIFDFLTIQYQSPLPRKAENEYTLGEFQGAFPSKFLKVLKIIDTSDSNLETELKPFIDNIFSQVWLRNQVGCHFNINGQNLSSSEVDSFLNNVIEFGKAIICSECGELPRRKKDGSFWQCSCGRIQLLPLERP